MLRKTVSDYEDTERFVAFFDSQGYGGGILTRLHTGQNKMGFKYRSDGKGICKKICEELTSLRKEEIFTKFRSRYSD
jgi:hypothetical protein